MGRRGGAGPVQVRTGTSPYTSTPHTHPQPHAHPPPTPNHMILHNTAQPESKIEDTTDETRRGGQGTPVLPRQ